MTDDKNKKLQGNVNPLTDEGLIIEKSDIMKKKRFSNLSFKFYSWFCWIYLLRSVVMLILWYLGIRISFFQMVDMHGWNNFEFFFSGILILSGIFLFMFYWNRYNFIKFRGADRRKPLGECNSHYMAKYYMTKTADIEQLKNVANIDVEFNEDSTVALSESNEDEEKEEEKVTALYAPQNLDLHLKPHKRTLEQK